MRQSKRVLKESGVLLAVAISRYAGAIAGLVTERVRDASFIQHCRTEIATGLRRVFDDTDVARKVKPISTAYFHLPDEFAKEIGSAGLIVDELLGILGPSWMAPDLETAWKDARKRSVILELVRMFEKEPVLGPRILAVCRRQIQPRKELRRLEKRQPHRRQDGQRTIRDL